MEDLCEAFKQQDLYNDPDLNTNAKRVEARMRIMPILKFFVLFDDKADLMAKCEKIGLPFAPIVKPHELFDDCLNKSGGLLDIKLRGAADKSSRIATTIGGLRTQIRHDLPRSGSILADYSEAGFREDEIELMIETGVTLVSD